MIKARMEVAAPSPTRPTSMGHLRPNLSVRIPKMGVAINRPAAYMANSTPTLK